MTDDIRKLIEAAIAPHGFTVVDWFTDDDGLNANLGRYEVNTDDYADDGFYVGDKGRLSACVVGAEQYHNQRVAFTFTPDGYDTGEEVRDLYILDPLG